MTRADDRLYKSGWVRRALIQHPSSITAEPMEQRTRMFKTLACLVFAMTGTGALLGWMNPSHERITPSLRLDDVVWAAQSAVHNGVTMIPDRWQQVTVSMGEGFGAPANGRPLTATGVPEDAHFYVDSAGRPVPTRNWRRQDSFAAGPGTIRIWVAHSTPGGPIAKIQWLCAKALIAAINEQITPTGRTLEVRLPDLPSERPS